MVKKTLSLRGPTLKKKKKKSYLIEYLQNISKNLCKSHFYLKIADYQQSSPFNQSINPPIQSTNPIQSKQSGIQKLYIKIENTEVLGVISNPPVIYSKNFQVLKKTVHKKNCKCPSAKKNQHNTT